MQTALFRHRYALACAFFVGFVCALPTIIAPLMLGERYQGIQYSYLDDEDIYRARIHEILDGYPTVASPYFYEYKKTSVVVASLNEWLYALPAFVLGLDVTIVLYKFLLPALLFWLVYLLVRRLLGEEDSLLTALTAIVAALVVTLGVDFVDYHYVFSLFGGASPRPILWTRPVNPVVGAVEVFGFLLLLWEVVARKRRFAHIFAGLLLAAMVGYFFSFGISAAILASLGGLMLLQKEYNVFRKLVGVGLVALAASSWYWLGIFSSVGGVEGRALALRNGMFFTHMPVLNLVLLAATILVMGSYLYAHFAKRDEAFTREWIFLVALLSGSWLAFNQQVITGREIWYQHFVQYTVPLSVVAVLVASFHTWRRFVPRLWIVGLCLVGLASLVYGLFTATQFTPRLADFARMQESALPMAWLREHASDECVVLIKADNKELERLIPAYTKCNTYITTYTFSGVPAERILHDYLVELRMKDINLTSLRAYLLAHESDVRENFFTDWKELYTSGVDPWFLGEVDMIERAYTQFVKGDFGQELRKYRIDYVISRGPLPSQILGQLPELQFVTTTGAYAVYSF